MKRVLTAVVLVPLVLLVVFKAPMWLFALVIALIVVLALHEYLHICKAYGIQPMPWITYALSLLLILAVLVNIDIELVGDVHHWVFLLSKEWVLLSVFSLSLFFGIPVVFRSDMRMALAASAVSAFGILYIAAPLAMLLLFRHNESTTIFLIFILLSVWAGDIAAYYVGRSIGRHKLAPTVSPNKTWEGAVASVIASIGVALLVFRFQYPIESLFARNGFTFYTPPSRSVASLVVLGLVTNVAAQFGDLFESAIKRGAQVKDSGSLLPGHGGILDRIDALLFAIPAVWYYAELTQSF